LIHRKILKHFPNVSEKKYEKWLIEQGPFVPDLVEYIRLNENKFDLFIFFTYLYYPIVKSLPFVKSKAICVLTLHDEPPAYFPFYKKLFTNDLVYSFNTLEEKDVFKTVFGFTPKRHIVAGMNIELACIPKVQTDMEKYIVYVGRIEDGKGVGELINYFKSYKQRRNENLKLYLIGGGKNHWEADEDIIFKGYVSEEDKYMYIQNSVLLVNSSPMESFSIVLMEAWLLGRAVLVNAKCMTLKNHCQRSNAGLYYQDEDSFIECLDYLIKNESIATKMGLNGKRYVEGNYSSEIIESKLKYIVSMAIELKKTSFA
jgi:glycosyltransferase involved in cell wall biosynthesis